MSMQSYPSKANVIPIFEEGVSEKLGLKAEWDAVLVQLKENEIENYECLDENSLEEYPKEVQDAVDNFFNAFEKEYGMSPYFIYVGFESEGCNEVEPGHTYLGFDDAELWERTPTKGMAKLQQKNIAPIVGEWTYYA